MCFNFAALAVGLSIACSHGTTSPQLLGIDPDVGPLDGGTIVHLDILGHNSSANVRVVLTGVFLHRGLAAILWELVVQQADHVEGPFFVMPNMTDCCDDATGVLISIRALEHDEYTAADGQLLFRLSRRLMDLAPVQVWPCCELKLSGGELLAIGGSASVAAPAREAVLRFRSVGNQEEVVGKVVWGPCAGIAEELLVASAPSSWHVQAVTPAWPKAEGHVTLEISWNQQQFAAFPQQLRFVEEDSFFGDVAGGISEEHLPPHAPVRLVQDPPSGAAVGVADGVKKGVQEIVTVLDDHRGPPPSPGRGSDMSHIVLMGKEGDAFILSRGSDVSYLQEDLRLIHDLFILTCAATCGGMLAAWTGFPSVIGFLFGGAVVGPGGFNAIVELVQVESVAELGVCLLLFFLGLEFSLEELVANKRAALAGLLAMVFLCIVIIFLASFFSQTSVHEALCIGLFASLSSTTVSLKAVPSSKGTDEETKALLAVLVTQDILLAALLATMPRIFRTLKDGIDTGMWEEPKNPTDNYMHSPRAEDTLFFEPHFLGAFAAANTAMLVVVCLYRHVLRRAAAATLSKFRYLFMDVDGEFFGLMVLSYAFGLSDITDRLGLSVELGSFTAGVTIRSCSREVAESARVWLGSVKEAFAALFFASIGLVVNGRFLLDNIAAIVSVVCFIFVLKASTAFFPLRLLAEPTMPTPVLTSLRISCILAHVGEFGFVLAAKGASWGVLSRHVYLLLVGANAVSLCTTPWFFRALELLLPREEDMKSSGIVKRAGESLRRPPGNHQSA